MAPTCPYCGEVVAKAKYKDQSGLPVALQTIGDTFLGWEYFDHDCPKLVNGTKYIKPKKSND